MITAESRVQNKHLIAVKLLSWMSEVQTPRRGVWTSPVSDAALCCPLLLSLGRRNYLLPLLEFRAIESVL